RLAAPPRVEQDRHRTVRRAVVVAAVLLAAFAVWPVVLGKHTHTATVFTDITVLVLAGAAAAVTARRAMRTGQRGWYLISAALASWMVGQAVWSWHELIEDRLAPVTSAADIGHLLALPLAFAGFVMIGFADGWRGQSRWPHRVTEAAVVATSLAFVSWETSLGHLV